MAEQNFKHLFRTDQNTEQNYDSLKDLVVTKKIKATTEMFAFLMDFYGMQGKLTVVFMLLSQMRKHNIIPDFSIYEKILQACATANDLVKMNYYVDRMIRIGIDFTYNSILIMIETYLKFGRLSSAEKALEKIYFYEPILKTLPLKLTGPREKLILNYPAQTANLLGLFSTGFYNAGMIAKGHYYLKCIQYLGLEYNSTSFIGAINYYGHTRNVNQLDKLWKKQLQLAEIDPKTLSHIANAYSNIPRKNTFDLIYNHAVSNQSNLTLDAYLAFMHGYIARKDYTKVIDIWKMAKPLVLNEDPGNYHLPYMLSSRANLCVSFYLDANIGLINKHGHSVFETSQSVDLEFRDLRLKNFVADRISLFRLRNLMIISNRLEEYIDILEEMIGKRNVFKGVSYERPPNSIFQIVNESISSPFLKVPKIKIREQYDLANTLRYLNRPEHAVLFKRLKKLM